MKKLGFTLAEVLITLGIIGIIAALTLPAILAKTEKLETIARLKKAYSVLSQGIKQSEIDNGDISTWPIGEQISDMNEYFNKYWKPYYKGPKICQKATDCGYVSNYPWNNLSGNRLEWQLLSGNSRILFILADGTFIFSPRNTYLEGDDLYQTALFFYVDINGPKKPNVLGKDVFIFTLKDGKMLRPYHYDVEYKDIDCSLSSHENYNDCAAKIIADGWQIKDDYPW